MVRAFAVSGILAATAAVGGAQTVSYPSTARQIAAAVSPLPEQQQAGARVFGHDSHGKLVVLRQGSNDFTCIADDGKSKQYHVACYHKSLEATQKTTGVTENPIEGGPWIMYPGKPWAHLMIAPQKTAAVTVK